MKKNEIIASIMELYDRFVYEWEAVMNADHDDKYVAVRDCHPFHRLMINTEGIFNVLYDFRKTLNDGNTKRMERHCKERLTRLKNRIDNEYKIFCEYLNSK